MSGNLKNISYQEFKRALLIIKSYCDQLDMPLGDTSLSDGENVINLEGKISYKMFRILMIYYENEFSLALNPQDLKHMQVDLLMAIDFDKMATIRGIGNKGIKKFKEMLDIHLINI